MTGVIEETISIGMPIPRGRVRGKEEGGVNTVRVKSSEQINKRRILPK